MVALRDVNVTGELPASVSRGGQRWGVGGVTGEQLGDVVGGDCVVGVNRRRR